MTDIRFSKAKNGAETCSADKKFLHSSYNPQNEAERFVASLECTFIPKTVLVAEPALGYCAPFLRKRFPESKIAAVRYVHDFDLYNNLFDETFFFCADNRSQFETQLIISLGEKNICASIFISWPPAANIFSEQDKLFWQSVKTVLEKSKTLLVTKSYFSKKWIKNTFLFCMNVRHTARLLPFHAPVVIAASGPSIQTALPHLCALRKKYVLFCVSSALPILEKYKLIPDIVISTDGGWWATQHLLPLEKNGKIPLALAPEAACRKQQLQSNIIIPLEYSDGIESRLFSVWAESCGISGTAAKRNGTVSGTAAELALSLSDKEIFACGLDLAESEGFQHAQPNLLEIREAANDFRLSQTELRQTKSRFSGGSLRIYRDWFSEQSDRLSKRFFRLSDSYCYTNSLGRIQDVGFPFFEEKIRDAPEVDFTAVLSETKQLSEDDIKTAREKLNTFLDAESKTDGWLNALFPAEYLLIEKTADDTERRKKYAEIQKKNDAFTAELKTILYE